mgnify:CR=1 FL=1
MKMKWKKYIKNEEFSNADNLTYVKDLVVDQFGKRPTYIVNEKLLCDDVLRFPKFFSARWFVSVGEAKKELVVLAHGETMELATATIDSAIKNLDWEDWAKSINE